MAQYGGAVASGYAGSAGEAARANRGSISTGGRNYYSPNLANAITSGNQRQIASIANASLEAINRYGNASYSSVGRVLSSGLGASGGVPAYSAGLASIYRDVGTQIGRSPGLTAGLIRLAQQSSSGLRVSGNISPMTGVGRTVGRYARPRALHYPKEKSLKAVGNVKPPKEPGLLAQAADQLIHANPIIGAGVDVWKDVLGGHASRAPAHLIQGVAGSIPAPGTGASVGEVAHAVAPLSRKFQPSGGVVNWVGRQVQQGAAMQAATGGSVAGVPGYTFSSAVHPSYGAALNSGYAKVAANFGKDLVDLPANVVPSTAYAIQHPAAAAQGWWKTDPIAQLLQGNPKGLYQHPLIALLDLEGLRGGIGGVAGRGLRGFGRVEALLRRVSPHQSAVYRLGRVGGREPAINPDTNMKLDRYWSNDPMKKAVQVLVERHRIGRATKLRIKAGGQGIPLAEVARLNRAADFIDPRVIAEPLGPREAALAQHYLSHEKSNPFDIRSEMQRQADEIHSRNMHVVRGGMGTGLQHDMELLGIAPKLGRRIDFTGSEAVSPLLQGIIDPHVPLGDLRRVQAETKAAADAEFLGPDGKVKPGYEALKAASDNHQAQLERALKVKDLSKRQQALKEYALDTNHLEQKLVDAGLLHPNEALTRRLQSYAVSQMGAKIAPGDLLAEQDLGNLQASIADLQRRMASVRDVGEQRAIGQQIARLQSQQVRLVGARNPDAGLVGRDGKQITNEDVLRHMEQHGVNPDEVIYVSHAPNTGGRGNFWQQYWRPRNYVVSRGSRGESVRLGLHDTSLANVLSSKARMRLFTLNHDVHADTLNYVARRNPDGTLTGQALSDEGFKHALDEVATIHGKDSPQYRELQRFKGAMTKDELQRFADNLRELTGRKFTLVRNKPFLGRGAQLQHTIEGATNPHDFAMEAAQNIGDSFISAFKGDGGTGARGEFSLVDEPIAKRLSDHAQPSQTLFKTYTNIFKRAVLSTSPSWLTGNTVEAVVRTLIEGRVPFLGVSYWTGRRADVGGFLRHNEARSIGEQARGAIIGEGHYGSVQFAATHTPIEMFNSNPGRLFVRSLANWARKPYSPRIFVDLWKTWSKLVFETVNGRLERNLRYALLGKHMRDKLMDDVGFKTTTKAIEQAIEGLKGTPEQIAAGRFVDRTYGRYSKYSPALRSQIAQLTPFIPWMLNATHYIFHVLPRDHPVFTALQASANAASEDWRHQHGLGWFINNAVPGWLQGAIPIAGGWQRGFSRYTPFGAFTNPTETAANQLMPQLMGFYNGLLGNDYLGRPISRHKELNPWERVGNGLVALATDAIPFASVGVRLAGLQIGDQPRSKNPRGFGYHLQHFVDPFARTPNVSKPSSGGGSSSGGAGGRGFGPSQGGGGGGYGPSPQGGGLKGFGGP